MITKRPRCLLCNKPLRKKTALAILPVDSDPKLLIGARHEWAGTILAITKARDPIPGAKDKFVRVWCGHYGDYGDDMFCNMTCGWRYGQAAGRAALKDDAWCQAIAEIRKDRAKRKKPRIVQSATGETT